MLRAMTNFAIRAPDVEAELEFLRVFGVEGVRRNERLHEGEMVVRYHFDLGRTHGVMFDRGVVDSRLESLGIVPPQGLSHVAFEIDSTAALIDRAATGGIKPLIDTFKVGDSPTGGPWLVTYFRSPNGTVIETKEHVS